MNLTRIDSERVFQDIFRNVRKEKKEGFASNIFPLQPLFSKAISEGRLFYVDVDGNCFFLEDKGDHFNVFFASDRSVDLPAVLNSIHSEAVLTKPLVLEHLIREGKDVSLGEPSAVLKRMARTVPEFPQIGSRAELPYPFHIQKAEQRDVYDLQEIFSEFFNPLTERIPDEEELLSLISRKGVFWAVCNGKKAGFIIFEKEGANLHLRYWWIAPGFRGGGIGSGLMRKFFEAASGTRRQFLWVFSDNENAIKRYRHYGFDFDGTQDDIYVLKN